MSSTMRMVSSLAFGAAGIACAYIGEPTPGVLCFIYANWLMVSDAD